MAYADRDHAAPRRAAGPPPPDPEKLTFGRHVIEFCKELTAVVIGAVIVASLLRGFVGQMFLIPSVSMQNTLQVQDRVVVEKLSSIKRGQVVVFSDPGHWLDGPAAPERGLVGKALQFVGVLPDPSTEHLIKRVVGMPGDAVACCDANGRITVNGLALDETGYLYTGPDGAQVQPSSVRFEVMVPERAPVRHGRQPGTQPRLTLPSQRCGPSERRKGTECLRACGSRRGTRRGGRVAVRPAAALARARYV